MRRRARAWVFLGLVGPACTSSGGGPAGGGPRDGSPSGPSGGGGGALDRGAGGTGAAPASGGQTSPGGAGVSGASAGTTSSSGGSASGSGGADSGLPEKKPSFLYVASASAGAGGSGGIITLFGVNRATWVLTRLGAVDAGVLPSFLAVSPDGTTVYATDETEGMLRAYGRDRTTGLLTSKGAVTTAGHPTYVAVDRRGRFVLAADYTEGKAEVFGTTADGALASSVDVENPGVNSHEVALSPDGRFAFVPNKGSDTISQFRYTAATGALDANTPPSVTVASGVGPRHMAFSPDARFAYVIDENASKVETFSYDANLGTLTHLQTVDALPPQFSGTSTAAEVTITSSGRFLYGSNRIVGADGDLAIFSTGADGRLTLVGHQGTHGTTPRHFSLDPAGGALFVANLDSGDVAVFAVDGSSGKLTFATDTKVPGQPYFAAMF